MFCILCLCDVMQAILKADAWWLPGEIVAPGVDGAQEFLPPGKLMQQLQEERQQLASELITQRRYFEQDAFNSHWRGGESHTPGGRR